MNTRKTVFRAASGLLSLLLCGGALLSCGSETETKGTDSAQNMEAVAETTEPAETGRSSVKDSLPDTLNFDGRTFTVYVAASNDYMQGPEESTGDIVDDAVIARNRAVEERLNIELEYFFDDTAAWNTIAGILSKYIMAGDSTFDLYTGQQYGITTLLAQGGLVDCNDLEYLDFSQPWWNTRYMDELAIGNDTRYFLVSDYFISVLLNTHVVYFNKTMYANLHEDANELYNMVLDGTWTLDKMAEVAKDAYQDLNNNGQTDIEDRLGYVTFKAASSVDPFMYLSDIEFTGRDADGNLTLNLYDERVITLTEKVVDYFHQEGSYYKIDAYADVTAKFMNGGAQFLGINTLNSAKGLREMEDDFGFLPYPKLEESQEYYNSIVADVATPGAVPATSENLDMAGAVIEALSAESYRTVVPTYYETALKIKYARDDLSSQVIDIIHDAAYTDFLYAYSSSLSNIGVIMRTLVDGKSKDYMSKVSAQEKSVVKSLDKLITAFESQK